MKPGRPLFLLTLGLLALLSAGCVFHGHGRGHYRRHRPHCPPFFLELEGAGLLVHPDLR